MSESLEGKVAVVIGGTGGIGAATATALAAAGACVVVTGQTIETAQRMISGLPGRGHHAAVASVADTSTLKGLADELASLHGRVDLLVNAAGFTRPVPHADLDALTDELIDDIMRVNWRGQFAAIREFRGLLEQSGAGLVVNVSSISGANGIGSNIAYCAAKAGLDVMTMSLARVLAPHVRILNVSPGVVDTGFVPGRGANFNDKVAATTPMRRIGSAQDIAEAVIACATHLTFSTGTTIVVDGGRRLG
ncbi:3-oxoacyl-[acyl-carrier protein] reductase [Paraburkholderia steynii]|uniref:3-oxoacyl-[acyl-carrier protein] reductase n=1 Tax=Paraburkholderia steynii TaxID=1245441 RepID=A0A7Z7BB03_9BURK|nr:SDR family oxidoreductase [Paraburkholderia steynii]SDI50421.1 3-oxoacyl-[acyl-carrier protein] reductase [Paraburkholderia steynii]